MEASIHVLHTRSEAIGHFIRLGHSGHRMLETQHAAGRLPIDRVVADASHIQEQRELLDALRASGAEVVLDTKAAELSTPGGNEGRARVLPWAHSERPHATSDFSDEALNEFVGRIARFAVGNRVSAVLSPTRPLEGPRDPWLAVDLKSCEALRRALDLEGGQRIAIDYPLLATYHSMRDEAERQAFVKAIKDSPFENLWLRISGFGSSATAVGVRRYINGARDFHTLGRPIIADGVGGFIGLSTIAFGAVGGISHGVAEKERFQARDWYKPRSGAGGGLPRRVYLSGIDTYFSIDHTRNLLDHRGVKPMLACNDTSCCPRGVEDMLKAPKVHFLNQRVRQLADLSSVPELRRADHFLRKQLGPAGSTARKVERLNLSDTKLAEKLRKRSRQLDELYQVLDDLYETSGATSRAESPRRRSAAAIAAAVTR